MDLKARVQDPSKHTNELLEYQKENFDQVQRSHNKFRSIMNKSSLDSDLEITLASTVESTVKLSRRSEASLLSIFDDDQATRLLELHDN